MEQRKTWHLGPLARGLAISLAVLLCLIALNFSTQTLWSHRHPAFRPDGPMLELEQLLEGPLTEKDYDLILRQTGLSRGAVDDLLDRGQAGVNQILATQAGFFAGHKPECVELLTGRFTCEDLLRDEKGQPVRSVPLAPLEAGDLLVSFSTHTWGWRHGHAGLITDPEEGKVLEAAQMGSNSHESGLSHWQNYSTLLVLRVKDAVDRVRQQVVDFARDRLKGVPYSLLAGLTGDKTQSDAQVIQVQCAYLPWLAWQQAGIDLDSDGGRVVTVDDLAESPELEVVQVFGMDPSLVAQRQFRG